MNRIDPRHARAFRLGFALAALLACGGAALGAAFPATVRLPRRDPKHAPGVPTALFSHRGHAAMGCQVCHPSVFPQAPFGGYKQSGIGKELGMEGLINNSEQKSVFISTER